MRSSNSVSSRISITPDDEPELQPYQKSLSSKGTSALMNLPTSSRAIKGKFTYRGEDGEYKSGDVTVTLKDIDNASLLGKSLLFFQYLICLYTEDMNKRLSSSSEVIDLSDIKNREIRLDIDLYMKAFSKTDRKQAVKDFRTYYNTLKNFSLNFEELDIQKQVIRHYEMELFGGTVKEEAFSKRANNYYVVLNYDLIKYLTVNPNITYFPSRAYKMDLMKQPIALSLTNTLALNYEPNKRKHKGLIKVYDLLKKLADIPDEKDIKNRNFTGRIIDPLQDSLNYLLTENILEEWYWSDQRGNDITDSVKITYDTLLDKYVHYTLSDYDDGEKKVEEARQFIKQKLRLNREK